MLEEFPLSKSTGERQNTAHYRYKNKRTTEWKLFFPTEFSIEPNQKS